MSKRLEILESSLTKKENLFSEKLDAHIATVKQANGQPLNDKRNGQATLNKWAKQNESLHNIQAGIERTKEAIERETWKIEAVENAKGNLPQHVIEAIESGELIQWRKHPYTFFVEGVDKARIVWDVKKRVLAHKYVSQIPDKDQHRKFAQTYNRLYNTMLP